VRRHIALAVALALASSVGCGARPSVEEAAPTSRLRLGELAIVAEGPCARLAMRAIGDRRLIVYGDTGYDLRGWLPGDELAAAQSIAVLAPDGPGFDPRLLAGLPRDARGYVGAELELGGPSLDAAWLLRIETRYAPGGTGVLFERHAEGYRLGARGWIGRGEGTEVERPLGAAELPALPAAEMCRGGLHFVPLASTSSPEGGVIIAGRCDDDAPQNLPEPELVIAHGKRGASRWQLARAPLASELDGIVNLELDALSDDDVLLVAWEPFEPIDERSTYAARFDGRAWRALPPPVERPLLSVARRRDGTTFYATGRELFRVDAAGRAVEVALPMPRHARGAREDLYVRRVDIVDDELWVEASHRVDVGDKQAPLWASVLYADRGFDFTLHCDMREPADGALTVVDAQGGAR
jgi:hypothetical protein